MCMESTVDIAVLWPNRDFPIHFGVLIVFWTWIFVIFQPNCSRILNFSRTCLVKMIFITVGEDRESFCRLDEKPGHYCPDYCFLCRNRQHRHLLTGRQYRCYYRDPVHHGGHSDRQKNTVFFQNIEKCGGWTSANPNHRTRHLCFLIYHCKLRNQLQHFVRSNSLTGRLFVLHRRNCLLRLLLNHRHRSAGGVRLSARSNRHARSPGPGAHACPCRF